MAGEELLASFFEAIIPKLGVPTDVVEDIVVGEHAALRRGRFLQTV